MPSRLTPLFVLLLTAIHPAFLTAASIGDGALAGTVLDESTEPIPASVTAFQLKVASGIVTPIRACVTRTDSDGRFECRRLTAGAYVLVINPVNTSLPSTKESVARSTLGSEPRFMLYPRVYGSSSIDPLHLTAGSTLRADIMFSSDSLSTIHITTSPPGESRQLNIYWRDEEFRIPVFSANEGITGSDGSYELAGVPPGNYLLVKSWYEHGERREAVGSVTVNESSENTVTLTEAKSYDIFGSVKVNAESQLPVGNATLSPLIKIVLSSETQEIAHRYVAPLDKDGSFAFKDVTAGRYGVSFDAPDGFYVSDIFTGDRRMDDTTIDVDEDVADLPLKLVATHTSAKITGSLELEGTEPKPGLLIHSVESNSNMIVPIEGGGMFSVSGLAPGQYLLYGWNDISNVPYESSRFLERYQGTTLSFGLKSDSSLTGLDVECNKTKF